MERTRVFVSLPFRAEGPEAEHPECRKVFDSRDINRFLEALAREIEEVSGESRDLLVEEIVLGNGSAAHFTADDLSAMIKTVRKSFSVSTACGVRLHMTPAGFDFYKLSAVRQMGNASICFEIPDLTDEGLKEAGYHCTAEKAAGALETCFQNGFRSFSVSLTSERIRDPLRTLDCILNTHPEEIILTDRAGEQLLQEVNLRLTQEGWIRKGNRWYLGKLPERPTCTVQIGLGPGAVSVFDRTAVRSTADFEFYCEHSDDFEALVKHAESDR